MVNPSPLRHQVLLAHAKPFDRQRIIQALVEKGWEVIEATNAPEVLTLAKQHTPRVIALDVTLASAGEASLVNQLKSDPVTCAIPMVFLTAQQEKFPSLGAWAERVTVPDNNLPLLLAHLHYCLARQKPHTSYVLVVDDEPDIVEIMTTALAERGIPSSGASNGAQALDIIRTVHPDVILLDMDMPQVNGWNFIKLLKAVSGTQDIRIIILTGVDQSIEHQQHGLELGAFAYLLKPCSPNEVVNTIEKAIQTPRKIR